LRWKECMEENELKININKTDVSFMEELWWCWEDGEETARCQWLRVLEVIGMVDVFISTAHGSLCKIGDTCVCKVSEWEQVMERKSRNMDLEMVCV